MIVVALLVKIAAIRAIACSSTGCDWLDRVGGVERLRLFNRMAKSGYFGCFCFLHDKERGRGVYN